MKALVYVRPGVTEIQDVPFPEIESPEDVIVTIDATSFCGSDFHIVSGELLKDMNFVLGHEMVGTIKEVGKAVKEFKPGDRVTMAPAPYCGHCDNCRKGKEPYCRNGGILGAGKDMGDFPGTHAEAMRVPYADQVLVKVPEHVSDASALAVADALTTGATGVKNAILKQGQRIAVIGCGPVGLMAVHFATMMRPSQLIAIDTVQSRVEMAKELGADYGIASSDPREEIFNLTNGFGVDAVIDCAGVAATFQAALDIAAPDSRISIIGIPEKPFELNVAEALMKTRTIWMGLGDIAYSHTIMQYVSDGLLNPDMIFNHEVSLEEAPDLLKTLMDPNSKHNIIKAIIRPHK